MLIVGGRGANAQPRLFTEIRLAMDPRSTDSSGLSSYFRELAEASKPVTPSSTLLSEFRRACGPWVPVTSAAAKAAFALAGVKAAGPVVDLVLALSGVGDAQTELLTSIKADTLLLRQEPLQTAVTLMGEANRVGPGDERWTQFLDRAIESLYRAESLAASSEERAVAQFGLACAYLTLNEPTDARHWIEESLESEREALNALLRESRGITDGRGAQKRKGGSIVSRLLVVGILGGRVVGKVTSTALTSRDAIETRIMKKRVEILQRFLHFANAVEICAAAICGRPETKILELSGYFLDEKSLTLPHLQLPDA